jgi:uncharacterized protein DUF6916
MLETLTLDIFSPLVGETFQVHVQPGQTIPMELVEARPLSVSNNSPRPRPPFFLTFKGPAQFVLQQQIYRFEHQTLGAHEIFIVPIGPGQGGMLYEVIFN